MLAGIFSFDQTGMGHITAAAVVSAAAATGSVGG